MSSWNSFHNSLPGSDVISMRSRIFVCLVHHTIPKTSTGAWHMEVAQSMFVEVINIEGENNERESANDHKIQSICFKTGNV